MRSVLTTAALCGVLATVAACSPGPARPAATPTPAPSASAAAAYQNYVALGDSFTAGPLIAPQAEGAPLSCVRSGANYPSYLAFYLEVKTFDDASCSGAETSDLYASQSQRLGLNPRAKTDTPPQFDALTSATDLVTLGIGGNDFSLFRDVIGECVRLNGETSEKAPCRDFFTRDGVDLKMRDAKAIQPRVESAIAAIGKRAPEARIVVVGYLRILPGKEPTAKLTCTAMPLEAADATWTDSIEREINQSLRKAADHQGATFVDAYALSKGHDACAGPKAWVNGAQAIVFRAAAFHPFREGMDAVARQTYRILTDKSPPNTPSVDRLARIAR